jgi:hypothetical protein
MKRKIKNLKTKEKFKLFKDKEKMPLQTKYVNL